MVLKNLSDFAGVVFYILNFEEVLSFKDKMAAINWQISWVKFCQVGSSQVEQGKVLKKLPNFAGVVFYSLNFEDVLSFKARMAAINWQMSWVKFCKVESSQVKQGKVLKKLPNFAEVVFYSPDFEVVFSFKAQLAAINWQGAVGYTK